MRTVLVQSSPVLCCVQTTGARNVSVSAPLRTALKVSLHWRGLGTSDSTTASTSPHVGQYACAQLLHWSL